MRNFGATTVSDIAPAGSVLPTTVVAFGHRRRNCGSGGCATGYGVGGYSGYGLNSNLYNAYSTYQPSMGGYTSYYPGTTGAALGQYGAGVNFGNGYYGASGPGVGRYIETPNPYGYYNNGQIWGSSGPTYSRPTPVWDSPSGVYGYRYNGWGSYGWGGWGGTGPAGWGYQGGFYW
ncbi:MAG: hypothetical protein K8U03_23275 [Planctomycetia bacterium]|nr:hypothetical protein [Planctomycetia bacterium]